LSRAFALATDGGAPPRAFEIPVSGVYDSSLLIVDAAWPCLADGGRERCRGSRVLCVYATTDPSKVTARPASGLLCMSVAFRAQAPSWRKQLQERLAPLVAPCGLPLKPMALASCLNGNGWAHFTRTLLEASRN
jgi:hypothetical protein